MNGEPIEAFDRQLRKLVNVRVPQVALDPAIESEEHLDGLTRRLVRYNVDTNERIGAYLLIPDDAKDKTPAVLAIHQHGGDFTVGKSEAAGLSANKTFHYGLDLCRRGYVVLCPDSLKYVEPRTCCPEPVWEILMICVVRGSVLFTK